MNVNDPPLVSYFDMNDLKKKLNTTNNSYYNEDNYNDNLKTCVEQFIKKIDNYNTKEENKNGFVDIVQEDLNTLKNMLLDTKQYKSADRSKRVSFMNKLKEVMRQVDNSNAVSTMGTLVFIDNIAKLNTVDTVCRPKSNNEIKDNESYKLLYNNP